MPLVDNARRWLKDRFAGDDGITVHPKVGLREVEANLANMTPAERQRNIQHVRAYASLYYQGRHNEFTPDDVVQTINRMDARAQRLDGVDRARQIVNEYGGPPSRQTVMDALDRSHQERLREHGKEAPEVAPTPVKAAREQNVSEDRHAQLLAMAAAITNELKSQFPQGGREPAGVTKQRQPEVQSPGESQAPVRGVGPNTDYATAVDSIRYSHPDLSTAEIRKELNTALKAVRAEFPDATPRQVLAIATEQTRDRFAAPEEATAKRQDYAAESLGESRSQSRGMGVSM